MIALLSDIHSNIYALDAVLKDMPKVSVAYVLGDTVGGANPFPCQVLDTLMNLDMRVSAILGNWEAWMINVRHDIPPEWRGDGTKIAAGAWTMDVMKEHHWNFLEGLGTDLCVDDMLLFHGSPESLKDEIICQDSAEELAKRHNAKWLIGGHTHKARLFRVGSHRVVNVGSVGLSCDCIGGTACYALLDEDNIIFRHVSYDLESAVKAIENSELFTLAGDFSRQTISIMKSGSF